MKIKLIAFDVNGTLFDDNAIFWKAINGVFEYFGKPALPLDVLRKRFGQPWTKIYREEGISENTASEKNLYEIYNKLYQGQIDPSPFKDIKPTLEWLKKKD